MKVELISFCFSGQIWLLLKQKPLENLIIARVTQETTDSRDTFPKCKYFNIL